MSGNQNRPQENRPHPQVNAVSTKPASSLPVLGGFLPSESEINLMLRMGSMLVKSGFLPQAIKNPEQAVVIMLKGQEFGLSLMESFAHIHVINGKPGVSSEFMRAQVYKRVKGARIDILAASSTECEVEGQRPGGKPLKVKFTWDDAVRAKLTIKDVWKQYPMAMLSARATSQLCRLLFPDALMGASHTPEELGAEVNEAGDIIPTTGRRIQEPEAGDIIPPPAENMLPPTDENQTQEPEATPPQEAAIEPPSESSVAATARLAELSSIVDTTRWPPGTVSAYTKQFFKTGSIAELGNGQWQALLNVVKNSNALAALGEFAATMETRA